MFALLAWFSMTCAACYTVASSGMSHAAHRVSWQVANIRYMFYDTAMFDQPETDEHFARTNPHYEYYDRYGRTAHAEPDLRRALSSPVE